ncbi:MAG: DNA integrity scanning protein DisA nucleotide-binding domain protein [Desulfamplus sp.]|nr:DNA integrity scanning protein DisA nucleotide-binding domain protein [Desulfamplus sp.]MBF0243234.1 DNA integrity scanning protein DisA nucleotide-binding domain protein [Desulfamplus sp.]MBF0390509.1 DNA integrity scanning protein DisA nucleotide-binding domain protein [Desulfamplus sp.]
MNEIVNFLSSLRWQDIIDIAINSYILFRLYVLFRGSRLIRIVPVVSLLWVLNIMALYMGLVVTTWAIQGIIAAAAIILIIVFRDEIGSVFQTKNLTSFLWGIPGTKSSTPIEIITLSAFELGKRKVGALLIFPGKQSLDEIVQGGIFWDGVISEQMIFSIFWDKNPVHDGAAIIYGDRITDVSVILPLSKRTDLPSRYGTRHRAAVGLCEVSDALVIVVSEERGHVTVVKNTDIKHVRKAEELQEILAIHTGQTKKEKEVPKWRDLSEFAVAALACFVIITGVWFGLSRGKETLKTITVPVEYTDIKQGFDIIEASTNSVDLHLSGSMPLLKSLKPENVKVLLKLGNAYAGLNSVNISTENIILPPGVNLKKVEPKTVEIVMAGKVERRIPVQVDWSGKLANNLILESVKVTPSTIPVIGVSPGIENVATVYTEKVMLDKIISSGTLQAGIVLFPSSLKTDDSNKSVTITYTVRERVSDMFE